MKRIFVLFVLIMCICGNALAYKGIQCEIESADTVLYVVAGSSSINGTAHNALFVKRISANGDSEYWLRERVSTDQDKLLYYSSFIIDSNEHMIYSIKEPSYLIQNAGISIREMLWEGYPHEYYALPFDIIDMIKNSKGDVTLVFNRLDKQGLKYTFSKNLLDDIKTIINLTYKDRGTYWQPNVLKENIES